MSKVEICKLIILSIKEMVHSPDFLEAHRIPHHFVRKRMLSFVHVVMYLLFSSKTKMAVNISELVENLGPDTFPNVSKQALSKARQGIRPSLFRELYQLSVGLFYKNIPERKLWHGLHVFAIDGTKLQLPNSASNFEEFGEMFSKINPKRRWSLALGSIVYDVLDDFIVHASIGRYLSSEREAAKDHLRNLEDLGLYENSVIVFDRGYYSEDLFRYCVEHGHFCLMRLKKTVNISKSGKPDIISVLPGDPKVGTEDTRIRVLSIPTGETEFLATILFDSAYTVAMFCELYFLRWPIEVKYLELKERLRIEEFNGATALSIQQEFYINLLNSNLASLLKADADEEVQKNCASGNKHRYQSNRSFILSRIKKVLPKIVFGIRDISYIDTLFQEACRTRSQLQPGRHDKRPKKSNRRERKHFNNRKSVV